MNRRIYIAAIVLLVLILTGGVFDVLQAQVPGYRGKHWSAFYALSVSPGMHSNYYKTEPDAYVGFKHTGMLDWVYSRNGSFGFSYKRYRTGTPIAPNIGEETSLIRIAGHGFGTYLKVYPFMKQGNIAPLGTWYKAEYMVLAYRTFPKNPGTDSEVLPYVGRSATSAILFSFGHNLLLKDIIFVNAGLETGIVLGMLNQQSGFYEINTRLGGLFAFNVNVGLGVLMF